MKAFRLLFPLAVLTMFAVPASAHHELTLFHQPPVTVANDLDAALGAVVVSTCAPACTAIEVRLHVLLPDGSEALQVATTQDFSPGGAVVFAIPAAEIAPPALRYWIVVS